MKKVSRKTAEKSRLSRQTIISIVRTSSLLMKLANRFFSKYGINYSQFNVLLILKSSVEGLNQTEIGNLLIVAKPNLVGMIDNLQELGYVERRVNPNDRRLNIVLITPSGNKFVSELEPLYEENTKQLLSNISEEQKCQLSEYMEIIRNNIDLIGL